MHGGVRTIAGGVLGVGIGLAAVAGPLADPAGPASEPASPWRVVGLPKQQVPLTRYRVIDAAGARAVEIDAQGSYGNLVHEWPAPIVAQGLSWRWRIEQDNPLTDLLHKQGDDHVVAVCVLFEMPIDAVPFWERQMLRLARTLTGEAIPAATLCYTWDPRQRVGAALESPYTRRVRWLVLRSADDGLHSWRREQRDLREDFQRLFGEESRSLPPLKAVLIAGDADNTRGRSLAWVADLALD